MQNNKLFAKRLIKYSLYIMLFIAVERWCYLQTAGFRESKILSNLEREDRWNTPLSPEKKQELHEILKQPFYYAGHGGTSYCFSSEDGRYVIKLFKHQHLRESSLISKISLPVFLEGHRQKYLEKKNKEKKHKRREFLFQSFLLAEEKIPEETALVHLQLNRSDDFAMNLKFYDKIGVEHNIPLNQTEFVLQRKATMIFPYLYALIDNNQTDDAKRAIDSLFDNLIKRCSLGLSDRDPHLSINFGFVDGKAVEIDIGSFSLDESVKAPLKQKQVIASIAESLTKKLRSHYAEDLVKYVEAKVQALPEDAPL